MPASPYAMAWGTAGSSGGPAPVNPAALSPAPSAYAQAWGTAPSGAGDTSPLTNAQGAVNSEYAKVWAAGDPTAQVQANATVQSKGHNNILTNIFHAVDAPRAALLAEGRQIEHVLTGGSYNQAQAHQDFESRAGVGNLLNENGSHGWEAKALGFVGDVATDPLTYLTLGSGDAAEMGAKGIADAIAKASTEEGSGITDETLQRFLGGSSKFNAGTAALTDTEKAALAERGVQAGGVYMRVPLTKLAEHLGVGEAKYIPLLGSDVTDAVTGPARGIYNALASSKVGSAITDALSKTGYAKNILREAAMSGDATATRDAYNVLHALPTLKAGAHSFVMEHAPGLVNSLKEIDPAVHGEDLRNALEHAPTTDEHLGALSGLAANGIEHPEDAVAGVRNWLDTVKASAADHGVSVAQLEDYFPHQLTDEAKAAGEGVARSAGKVAPEFRRTIDGTVQDINDSRSVPLFKDNPHEVLPKYLQQMGRRVGEADFLQKLKDAGTVSPRYGTEETLQRLGAMDAAPLPSAEQMYGDAQAKGQNLYDTLMGRSPEAQVQNLEKQQELFPTGDDTKAATALRSSPKAQAAFVDLMQPGNAELTGTLKAFSDSAQQAPAWLPEALDKVNSIPKQGTLNAFLKKYYDPQLRLWKAYSLLTPGKALRHQFGTAFNAWLANVSLANMGEAFSMLKDYHGQGGLEGLDEASREAVSAALKENVFHSSQFTEDEERLLGAPPKKGALTTGKFNPINPDNVLLKTNMNIQNRAQDYMRFAVFHDAMQKGMDSAQAADKVRTFLFDWGDHSNFEQSVLKRLVPFYTFTRKNVPLMLHQMAIQPGKFQTFYHLAQNIEVGVKPDALEPQFFKDAMGVHLPFKSNGNSTYWRPDLPFARLGETLNDVGQLAHGNPDGIMAQTTPLLKTPIEEWAGKSFYTGQKFPGTDASTGPHVQEAPGAWTKVPGLMEALNAAGLAHKVSQGFVGTNKAPINPGDWAMTPKAIYGVESLVPGLSQARRILPSEPNMQSRGGTNQLAYFLGQNFSTNDPTQQSGELWNRYFALQKLYNVLQDKGLARQSKYAP